jgi:hypothetical protein
LIPNGPIPSSGSGKNAVPICVTLEEFEKIPPPNAPTYILLQSQGQGSQQSHAIAEAYTDKTANSVSRVFLPNKLNIFPPDFALFKKNCT